MESYSKLTDIELNNEILSTKTNHDIIKEKILVCIDEIEKFEEIINSDLKELRIYEDKYIKLINELNNR